MAIGFVNLAFDPIPFAHPDVLPAKVYGVGRGERESG